MAPHSSNHGACHNCAIINCLELSLISHYLRGVFLTIVCTRRLTIATSLGKDEHGAASSNLLA